MSDELDFYIVDDIPEYVFIIADDEEQEQYIALKGETGSFKYEKVAELPAAGEDGVLYLVPKSHTEQTASGNQISITVSDKAGAFDDVKVLGNATQADTPTPSAPVAVNTVTGRQTVTVTGKNLINPDVTLSNKYLSDDGLYHTGTYVEYLNEEWANTPSTSYTFSASARSGNSAYLRFCQYKSDGTFISRTLISALSQTVTTTSECHSVKISMNNLASGNHFVNPMLELGNQVTSFEPYQGQDHEINLGKNLFDKNATLSADRRIATGNGNTYTSAGYTTSDYTKVNPSTIYSLTAGITSYFSWYKADKTYISGGSWTNGGQQASPSNAYYVRFDFQTSNVDSVQLEKGGIATDYSAYFEPIELCKIGTYQDKIYKTGGKWYLHKEIGKVVLDGSEGWTWQPSGGYNRAGITPSGVYIYTDTARHSSTVMSSHFTASTTNDYGIVFQYEERTWFYPQATITTLADFKTWLGTALPSVYYALATPTTTEITNAGLVAQLEAMLAAQLKNGVNNIILTPAGSNAAGNLELIYHEYDPTNRYNKWLWINADAAYEQM